VVRLSVTLMTVASTSTLSPDRFAALTIFAVSPHVSASCASCSSAQRFACGFLQIRIAMDTLAVWLAVPLIAPAKVFHLIPLSTAARTKKKPRLRSKLGLNY
jgi:hypothetical protein